jgi:signal transduction histidine kinase
VKSEREQKAEERAVGEQAVCNWVCHEIRNPLNALQFCIEEVTKDHSLVETHTGTMQQCSKHILSVITNMLELSKLTEGKISHSILLAPAL